MSPNQFKKSSSLFEYLLLSIHLFFPYIFLYFVTNISPLGDKKILHELLPKLLEFHLKVKKSNFDPVQGLYFNTDNRDGMEASIGTANYNLIIYSNYINDVII